MRFFSLLSLLIVVVIVGWLSAMYLGSMTRGGLAQSAPKTEAVSPAATGSSGVTESPQIRNIPIDKARELVNQDKERQKKMQEALNP